VCVFRPSLVRALGSPWVTITKIAGVGNLLSHLIEREREREREIKKKGKTPARKGYAGPAVSTGGS